MGIIWAHHKLYARTSVDKFGGWPNVSPALYLAGEAMDVDGDCGGYNLQWAWSSGYAAAKALADHMAQTT
ncbi:MULTISPECIES: NAD(P)/FAD-dependent oxidoreductase [Paenibacillus]|nr:NAD(P)/FAD-dependent oxidoreductase [Paenibacillus anaericanus]